MIISADMRPFTDISVSVFMFADLTTFILQIDNAENILLFSHYVKKIMIIFLI